MLEHRSCRSLTLRQEAGVKGAKAKQQEAVSFQQLTKRQQLKVCIDFPAVFTRADGPLHA